MNREYRDHVLVGRISGLFGVNGWVKVFSYTEPRDNIVRYRRWRLLRAGDERRIDVVSGSSHGHSVVVKLHGVHDRDAAAGLIGAHIAVGLDQLDPLPDGDYYWAQLLGLEVVDLQERILGTVGHLLRTGAHDVLVLEGERQRLIPFVRDRVVKDIDLGAGVIRVDWSPDY
jgi:16S rRNA processing protein RimM